MFASFAMQNQYGSKVSLKNILILLSIQVAYYEIRDGGNFYVFSAGRYTGDHRLVESGNGTSPTDLLNHRALVQGESCATYYRITAQSGLYICENARNVLVASTYDFVADSPVSVRSECRKIKTNDSSDSG